MTQPGQQLLQRRQRGVVGDVGRGEQQRRLLAVQVGKLGLELDVVVRGARDVARAARAGAGRIERLVHGGEHGGMLAHAKVVVGAPDGDRPWRRRREVPGGRETGRDRAGCRRIPGSGLRPSGPSMPRQRPVCNPLPTSRCPCANTKTAGWPVHTQLMLRGILDEAARTGSPLLCRMGRGAAVHSENCEMPVGLRGRCSIRRRLRSDAILLIDIAAELNFAVLRRPGGDIGEIKCDGPASASRRAAGRFPYLLHMLGAPALIGHHPGG